MTNRQITALALKLYVVFLMTTIIANLPKVFSLVLTLHNLGAATTSTLAMNILLMVSIVAAGVLAWKIWLMANAISQKAVSTESGSESVVPLPANIEQIVLVAVGLILFIEAFATLPTPVFAAIREIVGYPESGGLSGDSAVWVITETVKLILGASLIIGPGNWSRALAALRERVRGPGQH